MSEANIVALSIPEITQDYQKETLEGVLPFILITAY